MNVLINKYGYLKVILILIGIMVINWLVFYLEPGVASRRKRQEVYAPKYIEYTINKNQLLIDQIASELGDKGLISDVNLDQLYQKYDTEDRIGNLIPELLREDRELIPAKTFTWVSNNEHQLLAGKPLRIFSFLEGIYSDQQDLIAKDGHYKNQDEFLSVLSNASDEISFSEIETENGRPSLWRFLDLPTNIYDQRRHGVFVISTKIIGTNGQSLGTVFMKIDDSDNYYLIYADRGEEHLKNHKRYYWIVNLLCFLLIWYLLPIWVYRDALKNKVKRPLVWAIVVLISNVFGLINYLMIRSKKTKNNQLLHSDEKLAQENALCYSCNQPINKKWTYCSSCGVYLKNGSTQIP